MIRAIVSESWRESPARVLLAIAAAPVVVIVGRALLVVAIVAGSPS